jgi:hypothetical protein
MLEHFPEQTLRLSGGIDRGTLLAYCGTILGIERVIQRGETRHYPGRSY